MVNLIAVTTLLQIFHHTMVANQKKKNRKINLNNDTKTQIRQCMAHTLIDVLI